MGGMESSQASRTRFVFVPTASYVSRENFTIQPVRVLQNYPPLCATVEHCEFSAEPWQLKHGKFPRPAIPMGTQCDFQDQSFALWDHSTQLAHALLLFQHHP